MKLPRKSFLDLACSYFKSKITQNLIIAAKNRRGRTKAACLPRFFKFDDFFLQNMSRYDLSYPKNGARHDLKYRPSIAHS